MRCAAASDDVLARGERDRATFAISVEDLPVQTGSGR